MKLKFTCDDISNSCISDMQKVQWRDTAQRLFDEWLAKEGQAVHGTGKMWVSEGATTEPPSSMKAILINIEPIEKCNHPKEKVKDYFPSDLRVLYQCRCGKTVQPKEFEEI